MGEWPTTALGDLCDPERGITYGIVKVGDFVPGGVPVIRGGDIRENRIVFDGGRRVTSEVSNNFSRTILRGGEIVLNLIAEPGHCAIVPSSMVGFNVSRDVAVIPLASQVHREYVNLFMQSPSAKGWLASRMSGSVTQKINLGTLRELPVPIPPRSYQEAIAEVLGALSDKVALNEQTFGTARELARAVMEELWVNGDVTSLTRSDAVVPSEWRRTTLGALCAAGGGSIQTGPFGSQLHASDYVDFGIPSVMPQNIGDNIISEEGIARIAAADAERLSKYLLAEGDIVYSRRGDVKRRALVRRHEVGWLCGTGCLRVRVGKDMEPLFMSYYLGEPEIKEWIAQHAIGATMPNLNTAILGEVPVLLPPGDEMRQVGKRLSGLDAMAAHLQHENRTLAGLRDTLLPQLLSGKLRVKDAVRTVEEVV